MAFLEDKLCVVIPMKSPQRSKQRLANSMTNEARESLSLSLFQNTLCFFQTHFPMLDVLVVSESLEVLDLAQSYQANTLFDDGEKGLNGALSFACDWVKQSGYNSQLIIPGDIAVLNPDEIKELIKVAHDAEVVIGVAKDGGTNALLTSPPDAIEFEYGHQSARVHKGNAFENGLDCRSLHFTDLALDIDQSDDLKQAVMQAPERFDAWKTSFISPVKERSYA